LALRDGRVITDPEAREPGRGAYVHPTPECTGSGLRPQPLGRAFRASVIVPGELVDLFD